MKIESIVRSIRAHLREQNALPTQENGGILLIHRTHKPALGLILTEGFRTQQVMLTATATIHGKLDRHFSDSLKTTHKSSTHHSIFLIPQRAVEDFAAKAREKGVILTPGNLHDAFADAIGGVLPKEWIVGHYDEPHVKPKPLGLGCRSVHRVI